MNLSVSTIGLFKQCPLQFKLHQIVGLRKVTDESAQHHLIFGKSWHSALEVVYRAKMEADQSNKPFQLTSALMKEAKAAFIAGYPKQLDPNDNAKTQESGCFALDDYFRKYAGEDRRRWKILAVEAPETYDNGFITHLDMVAEDREHSGVYGFDFKTTKKSLNYDYWAKFEPNSQIVRYADFIASKYGSCEGFYIRATQFGYRSRAYKGEPAGFYVKHEAQLFNVNEDKIKAERDSSSYWQWMIEQARAFDEWGMNTDHCQFCTYRGICVNGWSWPQDESLITNQYRMVCNQLTPNLRACELEPGHDGPHTEERPLEQDEMTIEVEL